jgi:hypothetical protein
MVLAAAKYSDRSDAVADFKEVWGTKHAGELDHIAVAVLTKNADGELQVERHDSTAKHFAWGGALVGAALVVVAPPAGAAPFADPTSSCPAALYLRRADCPVADTRR